MDCSSVLFEVGNRTQLLSHIKYCFFYPPGVMIVLWNGLNKSTEWVRQQIVFPLNIMDAYHSFNNS